MGEIAIVNARRRRGKKKSSKRRRRHHRAAASNPHRRRRRSSHRRRSYHRRRASSNPGFRSAGLMSGFNLALGVAGGAIGTNIATGAILKFVPGVPAQLQSGLGKAALKLGVGVVLVPALLKATIGRRSGSFGSTLARNVAAGAWAAVILELYGTYVAPSLGLGDYEFMTGYQELGPENSPLGALVEGEGMGAGENIYADTMYGY